MRFAGYCLNIPHEPHDYRPVSQALRLDSLSARRDNFGIAFIQRLIEGRVDAPRILEELSFRIPSNTRLQNTFYTTTNKSNFSRNAPLSRLMHNLNNSSEY
ncbi:Reverse transcriptase domain-containing protein [Aphis craccivora]|uniref:Reverse transcriptase domain-containing protein n=1 Tax=Aphis craccivora TaxID=307492 RepID=A0A6G0ZHJ8_APHCR|nr:Reverse transcriptase domain-containing protein [Aphis craccivora]